MKKYNRDSLGIEFESEFVSKCTHFSMRHLGKNLVTVATRRQDLHEGTDFIFDGVRIDPTMNFAGKDNTLQFRNSTLNLVLKTLNGNVTIKVDYGIRTGNAVAKFNEPVLVIGFSTSEIVDEWNHVMKVLDRHIGTILDKGISLYDKAMRKYGPAGVPA